MTKNVFQKLELLVEDSLERVSARNLRAFCERHKPSVDELRSEARRLHDLQQKYEEEWSQAVATEQEKAEAEVLSREPIEPARDVFARPFRGAMLRFVQKWLGDATGDGFPAGYPALPGERIEGDHRADGQKYNILVQVIREFYLKNDEPPALKALRRQIADIVIESRKACLGGRAAARSEAAERGVGPRETEAFKQAEAKINQLDRKRVEIMREIERTWFTCGSEPHWGPPSSREWKLKLFEEQLLREAAQQLPKAISARELEDGTAFPDASVEVLGRWLEGVRDRRERS